MKRERGILKPVDFKPLQQYLPFTVLKRRKEALWILINIRHVATVLTVYGIETMVGSVIIMAAMKLQQYLPFTVLKHWRLLSTMYPSFGLQQYLPFTVLKLIIINVFVLYHKLQQYLPFTVLKLNLLSLLMVTITTVATVLTVYGIETDAPR